MLKTKNEKCACCGRDTGIAKDVPIDDRMYYIEGCGQLCSDCYVDLYIRKDDDETVVSDDELNELIKMCAENNKR